MDVNERVAALEAQLEQVWHHLHTILGLDPKTTPIEMPPEEGEDH